MYWDEATQQYGYVLTKIAGDRDSYGFYDLRSQQSKLTRLLYLPGFNIKTQLFYGRRSHAFVDYDFKKLTAYDLRLLLRLWKQRSIGLAGSLASHLPEPVKNSLKSLLRSKGSSL